MTKLRIVSYVRKDAMHAQVLLTVLNVTWMVHIEVVNIVIVMYTIMIQIKQFVMNALKIVKFV